LIWSPVRTAVLVRDDYPIGGGVPLLSRCVLELLAVGGENDVDELEDGERSFR
jgi:hypothetical protein